MITMATYFDRGTKVMGIEFRNQKGDRLKKKDFDIDTLAIGNLMCQYPSTITYVELSTGELHVQIQCVDMTLEAVQKCKELASLVRQCFKKKARLDASAIKQALIEAVLDLNRERL